MPKGKVRKIAEKMDQGRLEFKYMNGDADDEIVAGPGARRANGRRASRTGAPVSGGLAVFGRA